MIPYKFKIRNVAKSDFIKLSHDCHHAECYHEMEPCEDMCALLLTKEEARKLHKNRNVEEMSEVKTYHINPYYGTNDYGLTTCQARTVISNKHYYNADTIGANADIVITDTGINANHVEFRDSNGQSRVKKLPGSSSVESIVGDSFADPNGHGTHVAGIAGGKNVGWAKGANIYSARIFDNNGSATDANIISWFNIIINFHRNKTNGRPTIVNMSWGGPTDTLLNNKFVEACNAGIVLVAAAGNDSRLFPFYNPPVQANFALDTPGSSFCVISVGSTDSNNVVSSFSNYGARIDIYAPGSSIRSANTNNINGYVTYSGTSMASPQVAGVIATALSGKGKPTNHSQMNMLLLNHFWGRRTVNQYYMPPSIKANGLNNLNEIAPENTGLHITSIGNTMGKIGPSSKFPTSTTVETYDFAKDASFEWVNIVRSGLGSEIPMGDDTSYDLSLGFNFDFYEKTYNTIKVSSNGYCTFNGDGTKWFNESLPATGVTDGIYPLWSDLVPNNKVHENTGIFIYKTSDYVVITWCQCPSYYNEDENTFQVILFKDGRIRFAYMGFNTDVAAISTIGIQNNNGDAVSIKYNETTYEPEKFTLGANSSVTLSKATTDQFAASNYLLFQRVFTPGSEDWKVYGHPNGPLLKNDL